MSSLAVCLAGRLSSRYQLTTRLTVPFHARWLNVVGLIFFFMNLILFVMNSILITLRFHYRPKTFRPSFTDQVESLFTASVVSLTDLPLSLVGD